MRYYRGLVFGLGLLKLKLFEQFLPISTEIIIPVLDTKEDSITHTCILNTDFYQHSIQ